MEVEFFILLFKTSIHLYRLHIYIYIYIFNKSMNHLVQLVGNETHPSCKVNLGILVVPIFRGDRISSNISLQSTCFLDHEKIMFFIYRRLMLMPSTDLDIDKGYCADFVSCMIVRPRWLKKGGQNEMQQVFAATMEEKQLQSTMWSENPSNLCL